MAKLYFYYSAMDAGKTTTLLQSDHNYRSRGMKTLRFTPGVDTRYQQGHIVSRIGLRAEAQIFQPDFDFLHAVRGVLEQEKIACILIDEAQFLVKQQVYQLTQVVDLLKIPVLAYGLRTDFLGEPFEGSLYLLAWADEMVEIKTICFCGKKALMNLRIDAKGQPVLQGEQVEIGGNERYVPLCRLHFYESLNSGIYGNRATSHQV
ncbi:MAG: thymidine kinase [Alphaproteobacteria bacterium]